MSTQALIQKISSYAPLVGTALDGPLGGLIGTLIENLFGASPKNPDELLNKINADPEAELKLKSLQYQHETELAQINAGNVKEEIDDVENARDREIQLAKLGIKDKMTHFLAFIIIGSVIGIVFAQLIPGINTSNSAIVGQTCGMLTREILQICSYYFGKILEGK